MVSSKLSFAPSARAYLTTTFTASWKSPATSKNSSWYLKIPTTEPISSPTKTTSQNLRSPNSARPWKKNSWSKLSSSQARQSTPSANSSRWCSTATKLTTLSSWLKVSRVTVPWKNWSVSPILSAASRNWRISCLLRVKIMPVYTKMCSSTCQSAFISENSLTKLLALLKPTRLWKSTPSLSQRLWLTTPFSRFRCVLRRSGWTNFTTSASGSWTPLPQRWWVTCLNLSLTVRLFKSTQIVSQAEAWPTVSTESRNARSTSARSATFTPTTQTDSIKSQTKELSSTLSKALFTKDLWSRLRAVKIVTKLRLLELPSTRWCLLLRAKSSARDSKAHSTVDASTLIWS